MPAIDRRLLQNFDWTLLGLVSILTTLGLVNLFSATHQADGLSGEMSRQLVAFAIGVTTSVVVTVIDYRHYERLALPVFAVALGLLALTLIIAPVTRGSQSWLFGGRVQPAEFAKLSLVLVLARYFHRNPPGETTRLRDLIWPGMILALPVGLIVLQRDMG